MTVVGAAFTFLEIHFLLNNMSYDILFENLAEIGIIILNVHI